MKLPQRSCRRRLLGRGRASMDDWNVRLTMAATIATLPRRQGRRKCTVSTLAVTTGPRATVLAARPAQMSIQLSTCAAPGVCAFDPDKLLHSAARDRLGGQAGADVDPAQHLRGPRGVSCCCAALRTAAWAARPAQMLVSSAPAGPGRERLLHGVEPRADVAQPLGVSHWRQACTGKGAHGCLLPW